MSKTWSKSERMGDKTENFVPLCPRVSLRSHKTLLKRKTNSRQFKSLFGTTNREPQWGVPEQLIWEITIIFLNTHVKCINILRENNGNRITKS